MQPSHVAKQKPLHSVEELPNLEPGGSKNKKKMEKLYPIGPCSPTLC